MKIARSMVTKNRAERGFSWCGVSREILKTGHQKRVGESISVFLGDFSVAQLPPKKYFSTKEFTRFLSAVSSQRRVTRSDVSFQTK